MVHALAPAGATVVDLGCGSGQFLRYFAERRPDLHLVGLDLSGPMVTLGNAMLSEAGLSGRVELRVGDMTAFATAVPGRVHVVNSLFALHHLPTRVHLLQCLREIAEVRGRHGAAVWIFDHVRPRRRDTAERFPGVFTPFASPAFNADSTRSLIASWSFDELCTAIGDAAIDGVESCAAHLLRLYQVHWARGAVDPAPESAWRAPSAGGPATPRDADQLARLFRRLPGACATGLP
jgi:SAM-dependent methyltransferase